MSLHDLSGVRFGRLVAKARMPNRGRETIWRCLCDCGTKKDVHAGSLKSGNTTSCGCWQREWARTKLKTHGMTGSREYVAWQSMMSRCYREKNIRYKKYGGRGIKVEKRWHLFNNFYSDIGPKPTPSHSLDRRNNDGNYGPKNCRWATSSEQQRNTSQNRLLTVDGETKTLVEWSESTGICYGTLHTRLRNGWLPKDVVHVPVRRW